jgi:hypothetical protein
VIREVGFRVGESIAGDWRAIGQLNSSSRRVVTRNGAGHELANFFFNFEGPIIQLQYPEGQERSAKSRKKYFWAEKINAEAYSRPESNLISIYGQTQLVNAIDSLKDFKIQGQALALPRITVDSPLAQKRT